MKLFGVTGFKNAGKTGLVERLVTEIAGRGLTVSTVKHTHHDVDLDAPGTDSFRHRAAGAREVVLASANRWAMLHELRGQAEPTLEGLMARMAPVDLVIAEGYKTARHPKVEAWRQAAGHRLMAPDDPTIRAVAADTALAGLCVPRLDLDDTRGIADFILREVGL